MKVLLWDIDGTLVLTGGAGLRALDHAFRDLFGMDSAMRDIAPHGKTDPAIIREIFLKRFPDDPLPDDQIPRILGHYVEFLRHEVGQSDNYQVLPGIVDVLEMLQVREDVLLGLATGNVESGARIKLQRGNLNRFFGFGGFGSDAENRTHLVQRAAQRAFDRLGCSVDSRDIWVIGDTPKDIEAGRGAGFRTVGVATGHYSVPQLRDSGADVAIADFSAEGSYFFRSTFME